MPIKNFVVLATLFILLICFHIFAAWHQTAAHVVPDEVSYLAQARYFSGKAPYPDPKIFLDPESDHYNNTRDWHYYYFGYPLIVSPIYWMTDTLPTAYKGIMVLNSILLSSLFLIIYSWIRMIRNVKFDIAVVIAFIVSIYPPYILQANIGWAENALIPGFALSCLLFTRHLKEGRFTSIILFSIIAGLQFTIHPRGFASTLTGIICLIALAITGKDRWKLSTIGITIIFAITIATKIFADEMASIMNTTTQDSIVKQNLLSILDFELLPTSIGNLLYLSLATLGLFLLGIAEGGRQLLSNALANFKRSVSDVKTGSLYFIFIASSLMFCLSIVFLGRTDAWHEASHSINFFLYGRYNEAFLSVYIALGLLGIYSLHTKGIHNYSKQLNIAFWLLAALSFAYFLYIMDFRYLRSIHAYGLFPWYLMSVIIDDWYSNAIIFLAPLLWTWLILQLFLQNFKKGLIATGTYFVLLSFSLIVYITPAFQIL
jgi:hypothetical protein